MLSDLPQQINRFRLETRFTWIILGNHHLDWNGDNVLVSLDKFCSRDSLA